MKMTLQVPWRRDYPVWSPQQARNPWNHYWIWRPAQQAEPEGPSGPSHSARPPRIILLLSLPHVICLMGVTEGLFFGSRAENSVGLPGILHVPGAYNVLILCDFAARAQDAEVAGGKLRVSFAFFPVLLRTSHGKPHYTSQMGSKSTSQRKQ